MKTCLTDIHAVEYRANLAMYKHEFEGSANEQFC